MAGWALTFGLSSIALSVALFAVTLATSTGGPTRFGPLMLAAVATGGLGTGGYLAQRYTDNLRELVIMERQEELLHKQKISRRSLSREARRLRGT